MQQIRIPILAFASQQKRASFVPSWPVLSSPTLPLGTGINRYTDRITICCLPRQLTYDADVRCVLPTSGDPAYHVYFATETQGTRVMHDYAILAEGEGTCRVTDSVVIQAPWWIRGYVCRTALAVHTAMLAQLPAAVLGEPSSA